MATSISCAGDSTLVKSGAVSKGYSFASAWEQYAPLTEQQQAAIMALSHAVSERPFPVNLSQDQNSDKGGDLSATADNGNLEDSSAVDAVLVNTHQFYKWFTDLESAMKSETEEKYQRYVNTLSERIEICDRILNQVDHTLNLFDELQLQHQAVATKTKTLHDACDRLLIEKQKLVDFAEALRSKLNYFDELENVATTFYSPNMNVRNENFLPMLKRLDECISYIESNPQYAESGVYLVKFRQHQSRALNMIRSHVLSVLKNVSSQVQSAIRDSGSNRAIVSEGTEASIIYVRFKAAAGELKPVLAEIESRSSRKEYADILVDCQKLYCEQRLSLVKDIVQQRISEFAKKEAISSLTRSGCSYLMQVCQLEHQLFSHFFQSSTSVSTLAPLINPLSTYLYDTLRPKIIHEANLDALCELVDILKVEVLGEHLSRRSDSLAGIQPTLLRILADTHERLTFRARTYIQDKVGKYIPLDEDLDYPGKLEKSVGMTSEIISADDENSDVFKSWYPPLEKTLSCLSKLYNCLEPAVFTGLAQTAVEACSKSIQNGSKLVAKKSSPMDGQLFLVKHLLILREQIAPFDIEFSVTRKELDFSHLLEHLRRILRGQTSVFDWSNSTLARTLSPRVLESQIDTKKELEKSLKATCEEFIMSVTKLVVEPMLSFVTKATAVKVALSSGSQDKKLDSVLAKPLKSQAFATPDKVAELIQKVTASIQQDLVTVMAKIKLYLRNPSTQMILFKPIKTNIVEAHLQLQSLIRSEYSEEEIQIFGMPSVQELQSQLDNLL